MALCSDSNWRSVSAVSPHSLDRRQGRFQSSCVGALASIQGGQVVSQDSCQQELPDFFEHSDWPSLLVWPAVAHVQECCRVIAWMVEQEISVTSWSALALDPGLLLIGNSDDCDVGLLQVHVL